MGWAAIVGGVYLLNSRTPGELRLGILYVIPVLLAAWHDGMHWGIAFALATSLLRFSAGIDQMPATTLLDYRVMRSEEHTSELQSRLHLVCRLLLEKKKQKLRMPPS